MSIASIKLILPTPQNPMEIPNSSVWEKTENTLGFHLPFDYKDFLENYGSGSINDFLWIFNPVAKNPNIELLWQAKIRIQALLELKSEGEIFPYELYPIEKGIFPFAATDNGDVFFLKLSNLNPENSIVINEGRSAKCEEFPMNWGDFLLHLLKGKINSKILPKKVFQGVPVFNSAS